MSKQSNAMHNMHQHSTQWSCAHPNLLGAFVERQDTADLRLHLATKARERQDRDLL